VRDLYTSRYFRPLRPPILTFEFDMDIDTRQRALSGSGLISGVFGL